MTDYSGRYTTTTAYEQLHTMANDQSFLYLSSHTNVLPETSKSWQHEIDVPHYKTSPQKMCCKMLTNMHVVIYICNELINLSKLTGKLQEITKIYNGDFLFIYFF